MTTHDPIRFLSLFSGIGGFDLGLERAGMRCVGQVEIDQYCRAVLAKHWPDTPRMEDVRDVKGSEFGAVDLVCGGFPCQDLSCAGLGKGIYAERSGLWWEMRRIIEAVRPAWVLAENVPALRTRGSDDVLTSLEGLGYACWPLVVGAWAVGAPHKRDRVWILGRRSVADSERDGVRQQREFSGRNRSASPIVDGCGASHELAHASGERLAGRQEQPAWEEQPYSERGGGAQWPARPGESQHGWEAPRLVYTTGKPRGGGDAITGGKAEGRTAVERAGAGGIFDAGEPESSVGAAAHGLSRRVAGFARRNALKSLGNSIVPQVAEVIGRAIVAMHNTNGVNE
jgi:DNA (cytosine-5)-methyltransferase 1